MSSRFLTRSLVLAVLATPCVALAQTAQPGAVPVANSTPDIETSKYSFVGEVNQDGAIVRSGPSETDYQVLKLKPGQRLTVVGMRMDWLKIVPPEGSFCLIPQAFIDKQGDGTTGRVINKAATVRVGSALVPQMHKILAKQLEPGTQVKILGETPTQEFYKIAPPKDTFLYVDKKFVNPVKRNEAEGARGQLVQNTPQPTAPANTAANPPTNTPTNTPTNPTQNANATDVANAPTATPTEVATTAQPEPGVASQLPSGVTDDSNKFEVKSDTPENSRSAVANAEATATAVRALQEKLSKLEDRYAALGQKSDMDAKPLADLSAEYAELLADKQLPPNARKVAEFRASQLKLRQDALTEMAAAKKVQEEAAQKQRDLKAEQEELAARVAAQKITHYAACGQLRQSSLQVGGKTLYRLVDPANSRLILYVRTGDVALGGNIDKFVAINGKVVKDEAINLTYIQPEGLEVVDPKQLNTRIFADYSPPSMSTSNVIATSGESASAR